jgi:hypothetical protein
MATKSPRNDNAGRNRKIAKFGLAGIAIIGVGAGLTSAAWTDNVWFAGTAESAAFELQGYDPVLGDWVDADESGVAIQIPATELDNVAPGESDSYTVYVRNNGTVDLTVLSANPTTSNTGIFGGTDPAVVTADTSAIGVLAPGAQGSFDVVVTGDIDWDNDYLGSSGTLWVSVQGQS